MADQAIYSPMRAFDANGRPVPGAVATFYARGTTTMIDIYTDGTGETLSSNPVIADASGVFPVRFLDEAATCRITTPEGVTLAEIDPVPTALGAQSEAGSIAFQPTSEITASNVQAAIERVQANLGTASENAAELIEDLAESLGDLATKDAADLMLTQVIWNTGTATDGAMITPAQLLAWAAAYLPGREQSWQTVARALGASYQNNTSRMISVAWVGSSAVFEVSTNGSTWLALTTTNFALGEHAIPVGHFYRWTDSGSGAITFVRELR